MPARWWISRFGRPPWLLHQTGKALAPYENPSFTRWMKKLHRSLLFDTSGRVVVGLGAAGMLLLSLTGVWLLAARQGGWRRILGPVRGTTGQRLHGVFGRFALLGLMLSASTGVYLSATTFALLPEPREAEAPLVAEVAAAIPKPIQSLAALQSTDLNDLRELVYPRRGDPSDSFYLRSRDGAGLVSPSTGAFLSYQTNDTRWRLHEFIYQLHTGDGLWWLGLLLGLSALAVPVLAVTGAWIWWARRRALPKLANNSRAGVADTVILVGTESNSTWGFAATLHDALVQAGHKVLTTAMNQLAPEYPVAERILVLTSTYGDADAPASASRFLSRLNRFKGVRGSSGLQYAVLGFGDRQFPGFCGFALEVDAALSATGLTRLCPVELIDRQSVQEFARWGRLLGEKLGIDLVLDHTPVQPPTTRLQLLERVDYGAEPESATVVFRFAAAELPQQTGLFSAFRRSGLPDFEVGDLVGITPPGSSMPRFYSLASSVTDGSLEICVRRQAGGLCSGYLHGLQPGDCIDAFIRTNPDFRPASGRAPVILVCAGTGIAPLAGFIRHNRLHRTMYLYWGGRHPDIDFLYRSELEGYLQDGRLTRLSTAFSRAGDHSYVQDRVRADGSELRGLIQQGAQILVCGGRNMAQGVGEAMDQIVAPLNISVQMLKAQGRYREDVY